AAIAACAATSRASSRKGNRGRWLPVAFRTRGREHPIPAHGGGARPGFRARLPYARRMLRAAFLVLAVVAIPCPFAAPPARAAEPEIGIDEWRVPWPDTRPRDPHVAPDGKVWFVGQLGDYAAWLDPTTGAFRRYDLPKGAGPHTVVVDARGRPWYAGNRDRHIGRIDPESGAITRIDMPEGADDPHSFAFDGKGGLWFTVQHGNRIGRLDLESHAVRVVEVPTPNARPYGIVVDPDGRPWVVLLATNKLATVDPADFSVTEIALPRADARPRRVGRTRDGRIWYVDYAQGYLGAYTPSDRSFAEWRMPTEHSGPYAMAVDDRDRIWVFETLPRPNRVVGFDPARERFFASADVPSGGGTVRHATFHAGAVWFGTDAGTIGRVRVPD